MLTDAQLDLISYIIKELADSVPSNKLMEMYLASGYKGTIKKYKHQELPAIIAMKLLRTDYAYCLTSLTRKQVVHVLKYKSNFSEDNCLTIEQNIAHKLSGPRNRIAKTNMRDILHNLRLDTSSCF